MTFPKSKIGDKGQRYQHQCEDGDGNVMIMGWSEKKGKNFKKVVSLHPAWSNYKRIDRKKGG